MHFRRSRACLSLLSEPRPGRACLRAPGPLSTPAPRRQRELSCSSLPTDTSAASFTTQRARGHHRRPSAIHSVSVLPFFRSSSLLPFRPRRLTAPLFEPTPPRASQPCRRFNAVGHFWRPLLRRRRRCSQSLSLLPPPDLFHSFLCLFYILLLLPLCRCRCCFLFH